MKLTTLLFAFTSLFLSTVVSAHVHLGETIPAENAMLSASPSNLSLTFSGDIILTKVTVMDTNKNRVEFGFTPSATAAKTFNWKLPMLSGGQYQVNWVALGADGHKMSGNYSFMVHSAMHNDEHSEHQH